MNLKRITTYLNNFKNYFEEEAVLAMQRNNPARAKHLAKKAEMAEGMIKEIAEAENENQPN